MQNAFDGLRDSLAAVPAATWREGRTPDTIVGELTRLYGAGAFKEVMQYCMVCLTDVFQDHFPFEDRRVLALARHLRDVKCLADRQRGMPVPMVLSNSDTDRLRAGVRMCAFMNSCECTMFAKLENL